MFLRMLNSSLLKHVSPLYVILFLVTAPNLLKILAEHIKSQSNGLISTLSEAAREHIKTLISSFRTAEEIINCVICFQQFQNWRSSTHTCYCMPGFQTCFKGGGSGQHGLTCELAHWTCARLHVLYAGEYGRLDPQEEGDHHGKWPFKQAPPNMKDSRH